MKTFTTACLLPFLLTTIALPKVYAQSEAWERINPKPVEASLYDCSLLPNNRIVAVGSNAKVIYSDNFGDNWEIIYTPDNISRAVNFNSVDFADEVHGMAVGDDFSIIKTNDGGVTWSDISPGGPYSNYDYKGVCFRDPANCYITGHKNGCFLLHSSNGGESWDTAFQTTTGMFDQVQFVDENTGFLSGGNGNYFFKSIDGGENWEMITINPLIENLDVVVLHFISQNTGFIGGEISDGYNYDEIILKTIDGGQSWYQVFTNPFSGADKFFFLDKDTGYAISPMMYANQVMKTFDGGESWQIMTDDLGQWFLNCLCINPQGDGLILGDRGQIFRSNDFGNTWEAAYSNISYGATITKTFITGDSTMLANFYQPYTGVPFYSAYQSLDRGATWTLAQFEEGISTICYVNDSIVFYCGFYHGSPVGINKSIDGGNSWGLYNLGEDEFQPLTIEFIDDQTGFVGGSYNDAWFGLFKTQDQGETWTQISSDPFNWLFGSFQFSFKDDSTGFITGIIPQGSESYYLVSHDQGTNWDVDTIHYYCYYNGVRFLNPDTGFLYGFGIVKTINGGQDWYPVTVNSHDPVDLVSISFPTDQTGYAINTFEKSNESIFKTMDGGDTWNSIEPPTSAIILSVNFFNEDEGVIAGEDAIIFKTQTGGLVGIPDHGIKPKPGTYWQCYPNPFSSNMNISPLKDISGEINVRIFDFTGRPVRHYSGSSATAGEPFFNWDGADDQGNGVAPGIYIICLNYEATRVMMKIIRF